MDTRRVEILVVDDDQQMRHLLASVLEDLGYRVDCVHSADAALERLRERGYALAISDIHMPEHDGYALVRALRWVRPSVPVLLTSSFPAPDVARSAREAGAVGFLAKPFRLVELRRAVEAALRP